LIIDDSRAGQVLFDTAMPRHELGTAITLLTHARLPLETRRRIGGARIRQFLANVRW